MQATRNMLYFTVAPRVRALAAPMLILVFASASAIAAAPIDCAKTQTRTERTICGTPSLLQADARLTAYFEIATQFVGMGVRGDLYDSQQAFPSLRDKCGADKSCILDTYKKQMKPLQDIVEHVKSQGPF